ncbi:MAG: type III-A CRISPR-associated protein Csm2 [Anaerovoracaceae bacterium]
MEELTKLNYVDKADKSIQKLLIEDRHGQKKIEISTSQIRSILTLVNSAQQKLRTCQEEKLPEDIQSDFQYVKMRMAYESGRDGAVRKFVQETKLSEYLSAVRDDKEKAKVFCRYMEALVAYHRFYGGKNI